VAFTSLSERIEAGNLPELRGDFFRKTRAARSDVA
jgi:hypothetical protein